MSAAAALTNVVTTGFSQGREYLVPQGEPLQQAVHQALGARRSGESISQPRLIAFGQLGRTIRPVFEAVADGRADDAALLVNGMLASYRPTPYLDRHDGEPWHLHFHGSPADDRSEWGGAFSIALATVLGSEHANRLGICQAPACDRLYVDISKNGTRRFCTTSCQNRVKAAAHRARAAAR